MDETPNKRVALKLPVDPTAVATARNALDGLNDLRLRDLLFDLRLVISEIVTNGILHGSPPGSDEIGLVIDLDSWRVLVEVRDGGSGFDLDRERWDDRIRPGRGLHLVDALADRWGVEFDGGARVWAEFDLNAVRG